MQTNNPQMTRLFLQIYILSKVWAVVFELQSTLFAALPLQFHEMFRAPYWGGRTTVVPNGYDQPEIDSLQFFKLISRNL